MEVPLGATLRAANGMPFATVTMCTTVVRVASILVAVESMWVGYSDGVRWVCGLGS